MTITFIGHATVLLAGSRTVLIDPFFTNNPAAAFPLDRLPKIDLVLPTHDHFDHFGDAIEVAKRNDATIVAIHELATGAAVTAAGVKAVGMNIGGTYRRDGVSVSMTPAVHSASAGAPCGFVIEMDGKCVYHAGDTALFSDMGLIPRTFGDLDLACLPIGGHYVMDATQAASAAELLKAKIVVPIHYNTWPVIAADPEAFASACKGAEVRVLKPGESLEL